MLISSQVMLIFSPWAVLSELIGSLVAESLWRRLLLIEPNCGSLTAVVAKETHLPFVAMSLLLLLLLLL